MNKYSKFFITHLFWTLSSVQFQKISTPPPLKECFLAHTLPHSSRNSRFQSCFPLKNCAFWTARPLIFLGEGVDLFRICTIEVAKLGLFWTFWVRMFVKTLSLARDWWFGCKKLYKYFNHWQVLRFCRRVNQGLHESVKIYCQGRPITGL